MVKTISALKARQNLGQVLEEVFYRQDHFVVKRGERPMAVLIPLDEYEAYRRQRDADFQIVDEIRTQGKEHSAKTIQTDVDDAIRATRRKKK